MASAVQHGAAGLLGAGCWRGSLWVPFPLIPRTEALAVLLPEEVVAPAAWKARVSPGSQGQGVCEGPGSSPAHTFPANVPLELCMACGRGWGAGTENSDRLSVKRRCRHNSLSLTRSLVSPANIPKPGQPLQSACKWGETSAPPGLARSVGRSRGEKKG